MRPSTNAVHSCDIFCGCGLSTALKEACQWTRPSPNLQRHRGRDQKCTILYSTAYARTENDGRPVPRFRDMSSGHDCILSRRCRVPDHARLAANSVDCIGSSCPLIPFLSPPPAPASCCAHQDAARHECKHHIEDRLSSSTQRKGAACQLPWMSRNDAAMFGPMSVTDVCQAVSKRPSQAIQTCGRHEPRSQACLLHGRYACTPVTLLFALSEAQAGGGQGGSRVNSEGTGMADAVGGLILLALPVETLPAPFLHTRPPVSWHTAFFSSIGLRLACACACACACAVCVPGATHYSTAPAADPATDVQQQRQGRVSCSLAAGAPVSERLGSHTIVRPLHPRSSGKHPWGAGKSHLTRV